MTRDRPVVRTHELDARLGMPLLHRELCQLLRDALGKPSRVNEYDRRSVRQDLRQDPRIDQRPHAAAIRRRRAVLAFERVRIGLRRRTWIVHIRRRHDDLEIDRRTRARVDDLDGPVTAQILRNFRQWTLRRRETNALRLRIARRRHQVVEALEREREMDAALRRCERMNLVDDDRVDVAQALA
jgi:hypothetical protein